MFKLIKLFSPLLVCLFLSLQSCSEKETDINDPSSVADFICEKTQAMLDIAEENDLEKVAALQIEVKEMEDRVKAHHGDSFSEFMAKMESELTTNCDLSSPNIR